MGKKKEEPSSAENIKVIVRCRPLNSKETEHGYKSCVDLDLADSTVTVNHVCGNPDRWTFDGVVNNTYTQKDVFTQFIMPMVDSVMDGFNSTVFAYGQSGSGKTHTMTGVYDNQDLKGIIPRSFDHIFACIKQQTAANPTKRFTLYCSFVELYNGKVRDLLAKQQVTLAVKESKDKTFFVQGAHIPQVKFPEDLTRLMEEGTERRMVDATELNAQSSRSHSLFSLIIECTETTDDGDTRSVTSKLNLVDLAGSERQSKTGAQGDTLKEGCNINLSLSALGTVIDTLVKGKGHVPFRSSPLTMLLKDSLGGSSKTCMFANIGPSEHNISETVSTLRFADRAKQIKNKPVVNMDTKDQKIAELTEQVAELKSKLKKFESGGFTELEAEVEELRERCGELEVDRENAVKGREADAVDFDRTKQQLSQQLDELGREKEELAERFNRLQEELKFAEEMAADEQKQMKELWEMCSHEFGEQIDSSDSLISKIQELGNGVTRAKYEGVQKQCSELEAELETAKGQFDMEISKWRAAAEKAEEELQSTQRKVEKLKEKLQGEQNARKQLLENHQDLSPTRTQSFNMGRRSSGNELSEVRRSASTSEINDLQDAIQRLEEERDNNQQVKDLEAQLQSINKEKNATIQSLMRQVEELNALIAKPSGDDSFETSNWKQIIASKDDALQKCRAEIDALEAQVTDLRKMKIERSQSTKVKEFTENREHLHSKRRAALETELTTTAKHRDELLAHVVGDPEASDLDVGKQLIVLQKENEQLRTMLQEQSAALEKAELLALSTENAGKPPRPSNDHALQRENDELRKQLEQLRVDFAQKENKILESLTDNENPLQSVVDIMRAEKNQLLQEVDALSHAVAVLQREHETALQNSQAAEEVERLSALLATPQKDDSEAVVDLKKELRHKDEEMKRLQSRQAKPVSELEASALVEEQSRAIENEFRQKMDLIQMEKQEAISENESLRADLAEEVARRTKVAEDFQKALQDINDSKRETAEQHRLYVQSQNEVESLKAELVRVQKDAGGHASVIEQLEGRVKERTEQLKNLRSTLENQRGMMDKMKAKLESQQQALNSAKQELSVKDQKQQLKLQEQADHLQKLMNKKLEALAEEHQKALARKDDDMHGLRKKIKKLEEKLEKSKAKYDEKVCEYADLQTRMEEQKLEQMQALREQQEVQIETGQDQIRDTLAEAKEAQRRKADLFAQGEVTSKFANLRAGGNAAVALSRIKGTEGRPPTSGFGGPTPPGTRPESHTRTGGNGGGMYDF